MKRFALVAGLVLAGWSTQAGAYMATTTIEKFSEMCRKDRLSAANYVSGVLDGIELAADASSSIPFLCYPEGTTLGALTDVSCSWFEAGGVNRRDSPANQIVYAVSTAWPCRR